MDVVGRQDPIEVRRRGGVASARTEVLATEDPFSFNGNLDLGH
jgi:hypothetical protein